MIKSDGMQPRNKDLETMPEAKKNLEEEKLKAFQKGQLLEEEEDEMEPSEAERLRDFIEIVIRLPKA